jgi:hypothetical protein
VTRDRHPHVVGLLLRALEAEHVRFGGVGALDLEALWSVEARRAADVV